MTLGFDVNIGGSSAGQPGSYLGTKNYSAGPGEGAFRDVPGLAAYHGTDTFLTEALTREANRAIDDAVARQRPFFLHFAHFAVHTPLEADARFLQKYLDAGLPPAAAVDRRLQGSAAVAQRGRSPQSRCHRHRQPSALLRPGFMAGWPARFRAIRPHVLREPGLACGLGGGRSTAAAAARSAVAG
jgi:hypothetical protein